MVAALWLGPCKPPMDILLQSTLSKIENLEAKGIEFTTADGTKVLKAKLLIGGFRLSGKGKCITVNVVQYSGYYGCPYCTDKGVHRSHRHLYLPSEPHHLRVQTDINK